MSAAPRGQSGSRLTARSQALREPLVAQLADDRTQGLEVIAVLVEDGAHVEGAGELARQILENPQTAVRSLVQVRRAMIVADSARYKAVAPAFDWATSSEARAAVAARAAGSKA